MDFVRETTEYETDDGSGNKHRSKKTVFKRRVKPKVPFCLMMFQDLGRLYDLQDNQLKVLIKVVSCMDYDNIVRVSGYDRKMWSNELYITPQTLNVALSKLKAKGLVMSKGSGAYQIDPEVFNMGSMDSGIEKAETYNAFFEITYTKGKNGIERKVKMSYEEKIDPDTGEVF